MAFKQMQWASINEDDEDCTSSISSSSSSSINDSLSSLDLGDDASSSSSSNGPLYELADLMAQLPIKRGLSKFYNGKSQRFGSLSNVKSVEDLGKNMSCSRRIKSCKIYGRRNVNNATNSNIQHKFGPKATIAKRSANTTKTPCVSSFGNKNSFFIHA